MVILQNTVQIQPLEKTSQVPQPSTAYLSHYLVLLLSMFLLCCLLFKDNYIIFIFIAI